MKYRTNKPCICICLFIKMFGKTVCLWQWHPVSAKYSLYLSQIVCFCHRKFVYVTVSPCLSQTVCVCDRQSVSVSNTLPNNSWPGLLLFFINDFYRPWVFPNSRMDHVIDPFMKGHSLSKIQYIKVQQHKKISGPFKEKNQVYSKGTSMISWN